jgi:hypothetical protein
VTFAQPGDNELTAAECGAEFTAAIDCVGGGIKTVIADVKLANINLTAFRDDIVDCFSSSGCEKLKVELEDFLPDSALHELTSQLYRRLSSLTAITGLTPDRLQSIIGSGMQCAREMADTVVPEIEKCVAETNPMLADFKMPTEAQLGLDTDKSSSFKCDMCMADPQEAIGQTMRHMMHTFARSMSKLQDVGFAVQHPDVCKTDEAQSKAQECILTAESKHLPEEVTCRSPMTSIFSFLDTRTAMCTENSKCMAAMTPVCEQLLPQVPQVVCTCIQAYAEDNYDELAATIIDCVGEKEEEELNIPKAFVDGPLKSMMRNMLRRQCQKFADISSRPDPCSEHFNPFDMVSYGIRGGGGFIAGERRRGGKWREHDDDYADSSPEIEVPEEMPEEKPEGEPVTTN